MCDVVLSSIREAENSANRDYGKSVSNFPTGLSVTGLMPTQGAGTSPLVYGFQTRGMHLFIVVESLCPLGQGGFWASHSADPTLTGTFHFCFQQPVTVHW